jgi:hypothetical protein
MSVFVAMFVDALPGGQCKNSSSLNVQSYITPTKYGDSFLLGACRS